MSELSILNVAEGALVEKKKKQRLVKHKRKNWARTDISEVEKGIEDLRHQELTGGVRAEKKDEELFYVNKTKLSFDEDGEVVKPKKQKLTLQEKLSQMKCYANLKPDAHSLPTPTTQQKPAEMDSNRQERLRKKNIQKFTSVLKKKPVKTLRLLKKMNKLSSELEEVVEKETNPSEVGQDESVRKDKKDKTLDATFNKDLWTSSDLPEINVVNEYYFRSTKKILAKKPKNPLYHKSALPNVDLPHPGTSYNPDYDDHQDLLLKAHLVELKKLEKEKKEMRSFLSNVKKMSWTEIEKMWLEEMDVKEMFTPANPEDDGADKESEEAKKSEMSISKKELKRRMEKLKFGRPTESKAKRQRKQLLEKIRQRKKENEKKIKIQQNEIYRLRSIKKEVDEKAKKEEDDKLKRDIEKKHKELFEAKRLGSLKYEEPDLELKLSDEITGNLRTLKPEGNILMDRYKSLQKRNIIEPRLPAKSKRDKFWKKKFEKRNAYEKTHYIK